MRQVRNLGLHLAGLQAGAALEAPAGVAHAHGRALKNQFSAELHQHGPGRLTRRLQARRYEAEGHLAHLGSNAELALARVVERHVAQVAAHAELHITGLARQYRVAHIVARIGRDGQRQVAVHARAIGAHKRAAEIEHPRKPRAAARARRVAGLPVGAGHALRIGVGKARVADLQADALAVDLPLHVGAELIQRQHGFFEHPGQYQGALLHGYRGRAALLRQVEVHGRTAQPDRLGLRALHLGGLRLSRQRQARHPPARLVAAGLGQRALPTRLDGFHQSLWHVGAQRLVRLRVQRQAVGNACQQGQIQLVGLEFALLGAALAGIGVLEAGVAAGPTQPVVGGELQVLGGDLHASAQAPRPQAALHRGQHQGLELLAQGGVHVGQRQVHGAAHPLAALDVHPGAHGPAPLRHRNAQVGMVAQARDIDPRKLRIQLPAPVLPAPAVGGQQRLAEPAHQGEAFTPFGRRRGVDAQAVAPVAIAHHDVHVLQRQGWRSAQFIGPAQRAAADDEFRLRKKPVGRRAVARPLVGQFQPRQQDAPFVRAPDVQLGALDVQLLEAKIPQRPGRNRQHHARQAQRLAPLGVEQGHISELHGRDQALGARRHRAQPHRYPQGPRGLLLQLRTVISDTRHNPAMQRPPGHRHQQCHPQQQPQRPTGEPCHRSEQARRMGSRHVHGRYWMWPGL